MSLLYPREPETFKDILGFSSETQEWIEQDKRTERATYLTEEVSIVRQQYPGVLY
jgi:hypothetical protein